MSKHQYNYDWNLKDTVFKKNKGKVFSCFACGGGSTMGYKLAGFDVIGMNEIDPKMAEIYIKNHKPKYSFIESITTFKNRNDLPKELYDLDILDGSPPCSSFSMAGNREKDWGKEKKFAEGQSKQILDTLFFDFIDLGKKLQPKIIIAENVKGLLIGNAKKYVKRIINAFYDAGYKVTYKLLDSSKMGVPQKRERVFFCAIRNDLIDDIETIGLLNYEPFIDLDFNEKEILFKEIVDYTGNSITNHIYNFWKHRQKTHRTICDTKKYLNMKPTQFNTVYIFENKVIPTIMTKGSYSMVLFSKPIRISDTEMCKASTFPLDYSFLKKQVGYVVGMSVPPVMMAQIANKIYEQWLSNINK